MPSSNFTLKENSILAAAGAAAGAAQAALGSPLTQLHGSGVMAAFSRGGHAATKAVQAHMGIGQAALAGGTAAVGGPAIVATAIAAAPYVLAGVGALVAVGVLIKGYEVVTGEELFPEKEQVL